MNSTIHQILYSTLVVLLTTVQSIANDITNSWQEVKQNGQGEITFFYRDTEPFIIIDKSKNLSGIEYELVDGFSKYIKENYGYNVKVNWVRKDRFAIVYDAIKSEKINGTFGISIISNTKERQQEVLFSPSYMHDINVLISSLNVKTVSNIIEYNNEFDKLTAVTILGTTYEKQLNSIRNQHENNFPVIYVENTDNVLQTISSNDSFFGYLDLPNYLIALNNGSKIRRQNIFSFKHIGYGIIYPLNSDWDEPIQAYFSNPDFNDFMKMLTEKYLGEEVYDFMQTLADSNNESFVLLAKEKELQEIELSKNELILSNQRAIRNVFIIGFLATVFIAFILFRRYQDKEKTNIELNLQRLKIEKQRKKLVLSNVELTTLNNEKNNLISILSHDLRAPANNIQGLSTMFQMENKELPETQLKIIEHIKNEAQRLNIMIEKILDIRLIEKGQINIKFEKIDMRSITGSIIENFRVKAKSKCIKINFQDNKVNNFILADETYLKQIIENLISNAVKFSNNDSNISVNLQEVNEKVILEIRDEGPGISKDDMSKMFGKFQRLSAKPTGGESSTGLGLSIVRKYVIEMKGQIWCESELKIGTSFFVQFDKYQG